MQCYVLVTKASPHRRLAQGKAKMLHSRRGRRTKARLAHRSFDIGREETGAVGRQTVASSRVVHRGFNLDGRTDHARKIDNLWPTNELRKTSNSTQKHETVDAPRFPKDVTDV
jgi:hypothetical protein